MSQLPCFSAWILKNSYASKPGDFTFCHANLAISVLRNTEILQLPCIETRRFHRVALMFVPCMFYPSKISSAPDPLTRLGACTFLFGALMFVPRMFYPSKMSGAPDTLMRLSAHTFLLIFVV